MTIALERPKKTKSAEIRDRLGYPIIDTDVPTNEFPPAFLDYLEQVGGTAIVDHFQEHLPGASRYRWFKQSWEERRAFRTARPPFWSRPTKDTLALATITLPALLEDLRYFLSIHPLELYTSLNRDFFKSMAVEKDAEDYLASVNR